MEALPSTNLFKQFLYFYVLELINVLSLYFDELTMNFI